MKDKALRDLRRMSSAGRLPDASDVIRAREWADECGCDESKKLLRHIEQRRSIITGFDPNRRTESTRDWVQDFAHENGQYLNECVHCGHTFTGHKRRVVCRSCSETRPKK